MRFIFKITLTFLFVLFQEPANAATSRFLVFGDSGTGEKEQFDVAKGMEQVCKTQGCDFALMLGDNIYPSGPSSSRDQQFQDKFESPYNGLNMPFYVVLGNHDYGKLSDDTDWRRARFEIEYSAFSSRWRMPSSYYLMSVAGVADFFAIDTSPIIADHAFEEQKNWFDQAVQGSKAPWKIAFGHHPYISNGSHGNAGNYNGIPIGWISGHRMKEFVESSMCNKVNIYFSGHDHDQQWLHPKCGVEFIVSGAAAKVRTMHGFQNKTYFEDHKQTGFLWVELTENKMTGMFFNKNAKLLYTHTIQR